MINKNDTIKLLEIGDKIVDIFDNKDEMPNGDFQACLEAQVMSAYYLGQKSNEVIQDKK